MPDPRLARVLHLLSRTSSKDLWFEGGTVTGVLRGVDARTAHWRPAPDRHSIWALTLHVAYWKYAVRSHLEGGPRGAFPRSPANFPAVPKAPDHRQWSADVRLLKEEHAALLAALEALDPARLDAPLPGKPRWTHMDLVDGILMHDTWHLGQIQMLKRLHGS